MPTATKRASNIATTLLVSIVVVWVVTFAAVGLGSDGVTGLCLGGRPELATGYGDEFSIVSMESILSEKWLSDA